MRSFSTIIAAVCLFAASFVNADCMSQSDAQQVADNFQNLIAEYSDALANKSLTVGFEDYSDSVITLIDSGCTSPVPVRTNPIK